MDKLSNGEKFWRDTQPFLLKHGYELRPRFRPGWIPSWRSTGESPVYCEDSMYNMHPKTIDATRLRDGKAVFLKRVAKGSPEVEILQYLSDPQLRSDPRNHTVPLLDFLIGEGENNFLVMPVLRRFGDPPFVYVGEVVDFVRQTLEGLAFLHDVGIAHRDCSDLNIMLDADSLYPESFHPSWQSRKRHERGLAPHINRADSSSPVVYYFTDYGISTLFTDPTKPRLVTGMHCQDKEVPELSNEVPYDPYQTDIFILGNVYRTTLTNIYSNLSFLLPLVDEMTRTQPHNRPSAPEALAMFNSIIKQQSRISMHWLLLESNLTKSDRRRRGIRSILRLSGRIFIRLASE
ncbi:hypothetical protein SCHPADRAFT_916894 [Schizopora paradoxa]|uniref:Protein kinase domain-containing protein n=1 Tax=Schizopora paradoxa TaxID=27342 RepID=A0A0H2RGF0_9AGAM|nr:hypothetical protein SCHPADRAFT_916894 [Schizopora paradoxa]